MGLRTLPAVAGMLPGLLSGCAAHIHEPRITLKDAGLVDLGPAGIEVQLLLGVTNPKPFDLSLQGYTCELNVGALPFVSARYQQATVFAAGTETEMPLPARPAFSDLIQVINHTPNPERIPFLLKGTLFLKMPVGRTASRSKNNPSSPFPSATGRRKYQTACAMRCAVSARRSAPLFA